MFIEKKVGAEDINICINVAKENVAKIADETLKADTDIFLEATLKTLERKRENSQKYQDIQV